MHGQQARWPAARPVAAAPTEAWERPARIEPVPGTPYGLLIYGTPAVTSGVAIGSLVCGVAAAVVALVVSCFGLVGGPAGWGPWVAGAFGVLGGALGAGAVGLGLAGLRRSPARRPPARRGSPVPAPTPCDRQPVRGRGLAVAGLVCGAAALVIIAGAVAVSVLLALA